MDFDEDDPLGDLLSDNSDDSFFNDDKKATAKSSDSREKKKSDLFGLKTDKANTGNGENPTPSTVYENKVITGTSSKDVLIASKNVDSVKVERPKVPIDDNLSFLDDIDLGMPKIEIKNKPTAPNKPIEKNITAEVTNPPAKYNYMPSKLMKNNEPIEKKNISTEDKKNIFAEDKKPSVRFDSDNKPARRRNNTDWLGILEDDDDSKDSFDILGMSRPAVKSSKRPDASTKVVEKTTKNDSKEESDVKIESSETLIKTNTSDDQTLEKESALLLIQQQESQLALALQLKAQEEHLITLNEKQADVQKIRTELETSRREHVNNMIKEQAKQREQLQNAIGQQHKRINMQIEKLLEIKSSSISSGKDNDDEELSKNIETSNIRNEEKQLYQTIQTLNLYHDKEKEAIEMSLRSQQQHLEEYLTNMETRFKDEIEKLSHYYQNRISLLEDDHRHALEQTHERFNMEIEKLLKDKESTEERHKADIKIIQEQNKLIFDNLRESYLHEQNMLKDSTPCLQIFKDVLKNIEDSNDQCKTLVQTIKSNKDEVQNEENNKLQKKEKEINHLLNMLEFQCKNFENESSKINSIHQLFEERYKQHIKDIEDEKSSLKKQKNDIESEKYKIELELERCRQSLEQKSINIKEKEHSLNTIEKDLKQQTISLQEEQDRIKKEMAHLNDTKLSIMELKTKYEQKSEELRLNEAKLISEKLKFENEESQVTLRMNELDTIARTTLAKQKIAEAKIDEAKYLQAKYEDKLKRAQENEISFSRREKQIAKEKILLSQERLLLYNERRRNLICASCKNFNQNLKMNNDLSPNFNNSLRNISKLDNFDLKNEMDNNFDDSVEKSQGNNIEDDEIYRILSKYALYKTNNA